MKKIITLVAAVAVMSTSVVFGQRLMETTSFDLKMDKKDVSHFRSGAEEESFELNYIGEEGLRGVGISMQQKAGVLFTPEVYSELGVGSDPITIHTAYAGCAIFPSDGVDNETYVVEVFKGNINNNVMPLDLSGAQSIPTVDDGWVLELYFPGSGTPTDGSVGYAEVAFAEPFVLDVNACYFVQITSYGSGALTASLNPLPEWETYGNWLYFNASGDNPAGLYPAVLGEARTVHPFFIGLFGTREASGIEETITLGNIPAVYPTITTDNVAVTANGTVKVMDLSGRVLETRTVNGTENITLNYAKGVYLISVTENGKTTTQKVILK